MATTIRINEDVKQRLKLQSIETGISQLDLANRYIIEGIKYDNTPKKPIKTIEELEKVLKHDGKGEKDPLEDIVGIIKTDEVVDSVKLKKDSYKR